MYMNFPKLGHRAVAIIHTAIPDAWYIRSASWVPGCLPRATIARWFAPVGYIWWFIKMGGNPQIMQFLIIWIKPSIFGGPLFSRNILTWLCERQSWVQIWANMGPLGHSGDATTIGCHESLRASELFITWEHSQVGHKEVSGMISYLRNIIWIVRKLHHKVVSWW